MINRKVRIFGAIFLIAIYINAIGTVFQSNNYSDTKNLHHSFNVKLLENLNIGLLANTTQSIFYLNNFNNERLSNTDNFSLELKSVVKLNEQIIETVIRKFISDSKNALIKYRKYDFIYPFHYFW